MKKAATQTSLTNARQRTGVVAAIAQIRKRAAVKKKKWDSVKLLRKIRNE